jgi:predicted transposase/invertase (TIGR01784 family)
MRTDTIFYQLFQTFNTLLFELIGEPIENASGYKFQSVEVKEKAFRFDGIFCPIDNSQFDLKPIYFVEVQCQDKPDFYWDLMSEIGMYLRQYKPKNDWKAISIFSKRAYDPNVLIHYAEFFESSRIVPIYLDELADVLSTDTESLALGIIRLVIEKPKNAIALAKKLVATAKEQAEILKLIETVLVYKFPKLTRTEIEAMFTLSDLKQTRVYQDARQEGLQEGERVKAHSLVLRQLTRRFGKLNDQLTQSIQNLEIPKIDDLADQLLDFTTISDLENWLNCQANKNL